MRAPTVSHPAPCCLPPRLRGQKMGGYPVPIVPSALVPVFSLVGHLDRALWLHTPPTPTFSPEFWGTCPLEEWEHPSPGHWSIPGNLNLFCNAQKWECLQHHRAKQCQSDKQTLLSAGCMHVLWWRNWIFWLLGWAEGPEELENGLNVWRGESRILGTGSSYFPLSHPVEKTELWFRSEREPIY